MVIAGRVPAPQDSQRGRHEHATVLARDLVHLALELAGLRAFHAGVELTEQGAPGQVVGDDQVVAVDENRAVIGTLTLRL